MSFLSMKTVVLCGFVVAVVASVVGGNETSLQQMSQNGTDQQVSRHQILEVNDGKSRQGKHYDEITPCYDDNKMQVARYRPCGYPPVQMKSIPVYQPVKYVYQYPIYQYPKMEPLPVFKPVVYKFPTLPPMKSAPMPQYKPFVFPSMKPLPVKSLALPQYKPFVFPSLKPLPVKSVALPQFKPLVLPSLKPLPTFAPLKSWPMPTFKPFVLPSLKPLPVKSIQFQPLVYPTFVPLKTYVPSKSLPAVNWPSLPTTGQKTSDINYALVTPSQHQTLSLPHHSGFTQVQNVGNKRNSINVTVAIVKNCDETQKDVKCNAPASPGLVDQKLFVTLTLLLTKIKAYEKLSTLGSGSRVDDKGFDEILTLLLNKKGKGDGKQVDDILSLLLNKKGKGDGKELDDILSLLLNKKDKGDGKELDHILAVVLKKKEGEGDDNKFHDIQSLLLNKKGKGDGKQVDDILSLLLNKKGKVDKKELDEILSLLQNKNGKGDGTELDDILALLLKNGDGKDKFDAMTIKDTRPTSPLFLHPA